MKSRSLLGNSAVVQSSAVRTLFLVTALVTVAIALWTEFFKVDGYIPRFTPIYYDLFAYGDHTGAVVILIVVLVAALLPTRPLVASAVRWVGEHPVIFAGLSAVAMMCGTLFVYHSHRLSMDEYTVYFQSQVFAAGHIAGYIPPAIMDWVIPPGFQNAFINVSHATGRAASGYWPAFALILAPFTWAGVSWACNPIITALTLLGIHRLAAGLFADVEAAGLALLFAAASPVIFADGISYYAMSAHLLASTLYVLLLVQPTVKRAFFAGVIGSIALTLHNPVPHIFFCLPWMIWLLSRKHGLSLVGAAFVGYLPLCVALGLGWYWYCGNLLHEDVASVGAVARLTNNQQDLRLIFHFPSANTLLIRLMDQAKIWVWAAPGLVLLAGIGAWRWRHNSTCMLLAASAVTTVIGYLFFPYDQGHGWGNRYFHAAWLALPLLATAAMFRPAGISTSPAASAAESTRAFEEPASRSFVMASALLMLVLGVGSRGWEIEHFMADDLKQLPAYRGTERRVVIIDDAVSFYGGDLVQNDPWLRGNEIRMYTQGAAANAQMMSENFPTMHKVFADRHGWVWSEKPLPGNANDAKRP
jgi:hypothetical protein